VAEQIYAPGPMATPAKYVVPGSSEIVPLAVQAVLDGTNASGDFVPALIFRLQAGHVIARVPTSQVVTAGDSAEVTWAPFLRSAAASPAPPASTGLPIATLYQSGFGPTLPATGARIYPFDTAYASPQSDSTDFSVLDTNTTTAFNGSPVWSVVLLAPGTYACFTSFNVRAADAGVTTELLGFSSTGGVGPSTFFQGRYGATATDTWQNTTTGVGKGELFMHQWFLVRSGQAPVYITPDIIIGGVGNVIANPSLNVVQLSPTPLSAIT
jgi:hypothetical protein